MLCGKYGKVIDAMIKKISVNTLSLLTVFYNLRKIINFIKKNIFKNKYRYIFV